MFKQFGKDNQELIRFTVIIATLGALFLNIPNPQNKDAASALAQIQIFWLIIFTLCLTVAFWKLVKFIIKTEKEIGNKFDIPAKGTFSLMLGTAFIWIIANLWDYIANVYANSFAQFLSMFFPGIVITAGLSLIIWSRKYKGKFGFFLETAADSAVLAVFITLAGIYIQQAILKYFYYYWFFVVLPSSFIVLLMVFNLLLFLRKKKRSP